MPRHAIFSVGTLRLLLGLCFIAEIFLAYRLISSEVAYRERHDQPRFVLPSVNHKKGNSNRPVENFEAKIKSTKVAAPFGGSRQNVKPMSSHVKYVRSRFSGIQIKDSRYISELQLLKALMKSFRNSSTKHDDESMSPAGLRFTRRIKQITGENNKIEYFILRDNSSEKCYGRGTVRFSRDGRCQCHPDWTGQWCSVPPIVTLSDYPHHYGLALRSVPRRIIYLFPFSHELDLLATRLKQYGDTVEAYIIVESNYTASGKPKPRYLRDRLNDDRKYLAEYREKIVIADLNFFPEAAYADGWIADELLRTYAIIGGITHLRGLVHDDILLSTDADEIPSRDALEYLRIHNGFPEPIGFRLRHHVFSRKWFAPGLVSHVFGACTFGMLRHVFRGNPYYLRRAAKHLELNKASVERFQQKYGGRVSTWSFGITEEQMQSRKLSIHSSVDSKDLIQQQSPIADKNENGSSNRFRKYSDSSNSAYLVQKGKDGKFDSYLFASKTENSIFINESLRIDRAWKAKKNKNQTVFLQQNRWSKSERLKPGSKSVLSSKGTISGVQISNSNNVPLKRVLIDMLNISVKAVQKTSNANANLTSVSSSYGNIRDILPNSYEEKVTRRFTEYNGIKSNNTSSNSKRLTSAFSSEYDDGLAGEHFSWCFNAQGILYKMSAAHFSDRPRWSDVIGHDDVIFINSLIERGMWFDNATKLIPAIT